MLETKAEGYLFWQEDGVNLKAQNVLMIIIVRSLSVCCRSICYRANNKNSMKHCLS